MRTTPLDSLLSPIRRYTRWAQCNPGAFAIELLIAGALATFLCQTLFLGLQRRLTVDEFTYMHAAWMTAHGSIVAKDFFMGWTIPLVLFPPFLGAQDSPSVLIQGRAYILLFVAALCALAAFTSKRGRPSFLAPALTLAMMPLVNRLIEFRPDVIAFTFLLAAVVSTKMDEPFPRRSAWFSGFFFALAAVASFKGAFCGLVMLATFGWDLIHSRDPGHRRRAIFFLFGAAIPTAAVLGYFTVTDSLGDIVRTLGYLSTHERSFPGHRWEIYWVEFWSGYQWMFALALVGYLRELRAWIRGQRQPERFETLLLALAPMSFLTFAIQRAAFPPSFIPFMVTTQIFAARGIQFLLDAAQDRWPHQRARVPAVAVLFVLVFFMLEQRWADTLAAPGHRNDYQLSVMQDIIDTTAPSDAVYDTTGGAITRPVVDYDFFLDLYKVEAKREELANVLPITLMKIECIAVMPGHRYNELPQKLKNFLRKHYQPYSDDLWLYGMEFQPSRGKVDAVLETARNGTYFISPESAIRGATIGIEGKVLESPVFELKRGESRITATGCDSPFFILWLPKNGKKYKPLGQISPRYVVGGG